MPDWIADAIGYTFAVIGGHVAIRPIIDGLWQDAGWKKGIATDIRPQPYHPRLVGLVERALYVASWQYHVPEFIGIWMALKAAGQWKRWGEGIPDSSGEKKSEGRSFYNIFLIGSGLSVAYATVGSRMIWALRKPKWYFGFITPIILLAATYIFARIAGHYRKSTG
jgi:hypothetical protein